MPQDTSRRTFLGAVGGGATALVPTVRTTAASTTVDDGTQEGALSSLPKSGMALELLRTYPNKLVELRDFISEVYLPPRRVRKYNVQSHIGSILYIQYSTPKPSWPAFSITEFATAQEAKRAHQNEYVARAGGKPRQIGNRGSWVFRRLRDKDGLRMPLLGATQRVENIIVEGVIDMEQFQNPYDSLTSQIKHADGRDKYGDDGFPPFVIRVADHYRKNFSYSRTPIRPADHTRLQTSFGDFGRAAAQKIAEDRLGVLATNVSENHLPNLPQDVCRGYDVRLDTEKRRWYEPLVSEDWFNARDTQFNDSPTAGVYAFDKPNTLKSLMANRFNRWWGISRAARGDPMYLSYTTKKGEQHLLGIHGSGVLLDKPGKVALGGSFHRYIVSGNILLTVPDSSIPRPE